MNTTIKYQIPEDIIIHYIEKSKSNESGILKATKIPFLAYKYAKLAKKLKLTHSLSFLTRPSFINILSGKISFYKYKIITNERAFPSLQYGYGDFQSFFNKKMIRFLYRLSDKVISNSQGNANDLVTNFNVPSKKMCVIHNPIDLDSIEKIQPKKTFFDKSMFNIVTVGRLDEGKNHSLLINAIKHLNNPSIKLYIFGDGILKKQLEHLIEKLAIKEQILLMGFDANPYRYLKEADLFVFGSNHEGFPNVLLEAMACTLPVLTTNCKSGPSEIMKLEKEEHNLMYTDYGILVPIKEMELMARGINYMFTKKEYLDSCKINVQKRVNDFKKDVILKEYIDVISSVA